MSGGLPLSSFTRSYYWAEETTSQTRPMTLYEQALLNEIHTKIKHGAFRNGKIKEEQAAEAEEFLRKEEVKAAKEQIEEIWRLKA